MFLKICYFIYPGVNKLANIIIVDDEQVILLFLESILKKMGHVIVKKCNSGEAAISATDAYKPDIIFMDINMPGKYNGIEASKIITSNHEIPVIFITAYENEEYINEIKNVGPFGYILKPFRESEIKIAINITIYRTEMEKKLRHAISKYQSQLNYEEKINNILSTINKSVNPLDALDNTFLDFMKVDTIRSAYFFKFIQNNDYEVLFSSFDEQHNIVTFNDNYQNELINFTFEKETYFLDKIDPISHGSIFPLYIDKKYYGFLLLTTNEQLSKIDSIFLYIELFINALSILLKRSIDYSKLIEVQNQNFELEKMNMRNQRLSSLGQLSSSIAHEINQPLQSIKLLSDSVLFWQKENKELDKSIMYENFSKISQRVDRINNIIDAMRYMVYSPEKIESKEININEQITEAVNFFKDRASENHIIIRQELDRSIGSIKMSDTQFFQIMSNLISNSMNVLIKNNSDKEKNIIIRTINNDENYTIEIIDNGPGVPDNEKESIFNPFYSSFTNTKNLGLGLFIIFNIIKSYDASINILDNEFGGATFQMRLRKY